MSEMLKVKFILYILKEMSLEFWKELINIFVDYGRNTENLLKKVRKFGKFNLKSFQKIFGKTVKQKFLRNYGKF